MTKITTIVGINVYLLSPDGCAGTGLDWLELEVWNRGIALSRELGSV